MKKIIAMAALVLSSVGAFHSIQQVISLSSQKLV